MLGKLMKYELKSYMAILGIMAAVIAAMTAAARVTLLLMNNEKIMDNPFLALSLASVIIIYAVSLMVLSFTSTVLIFKRFYTNNFGREGYLTFTLPVKITQIYWSKYLTALIIMLITAAITAASLFCIGVGGVFNDVFKFTISIKALFMQMSSLENMTTLYVGNGIMYALGILYSVFTMFFSICIGQKAKAHPVIWSVLCFLGISYAISLLSDIVVTVTSVFGGDGGLMGSSNGVWLYIANVIIVCVIYIAASVTEYILSIRIMKKQLNLK